MIHSKDCTILFCVERGAGLGFVELVVTEDEGVGELLLQAYHVTHLCCMAHARAKFSEALSILFHTFISTCSMMGISAQKYFKMFSVLS